MMSFLALSQIKAATPDVTDEDNLLSTGFTTTAEFRQFTIINVEEGSNTWKHSTGNPYAKIENDLGNKIPKDDYLVSPAFELKAGRTYRLTFDTWCGSPAYPEIVAAYLLTDATNITDKTVIIEPTSVTNDTNNKRELTGYFSPEKDGTYHVAIHAASAPGMHYLYVDNVEISRGVNGESPASVADYKVTPSPLGEDEVTVSFKAPEFCHDGVTPLSGIKSYTVKREGTVIAEITPVEGQESYSFSDKVSKDGWYAYSVTVNAASGKSLDARKMVYVGQARPASPVNLRAKETETGTVELTWDAVTTNVYGFEIDPSLVTYNIYDGPYNLFMTGVADNKLNLEYVAAGQPQKIPAFSVKAVTSKGESAEAATAAPIPVGPAHTMPYAETFAGSHITSGQPAEFISDEKLPLTYWRCFEEVADADIIPVKFDRGLMAFYANEAGRTGIYRTGKIQIDADASNPYLSLFYFSIPGAEDHFTIGINDDVVADVVIGGETRGWIEKLIPMEAYKGHIIRLTLTAYCKNPTNPIAVDDISIKNEFNNDLAISRARIPYEMHIGQDHICSFKVINNGVNTSGDYRLNIYAEGEIVKSFEGNGLERGKTDEYSFIAKPALTPGKSVVYNVELSAATEDKPEDNSVAIEVKIPESFLPAPANLTLTDTKLKWDAFEKSDYPAREITESFEAYDEFTINTAGEWSFYDGDMYPTFGLEDGYHSYPNMYEPMAFMVFNNHDNFFVGMGTMSFAMIDGGQCMASMAINCANEIEITNDDWMISPELTGEAQTISFFARGTSLVFRETFQVLYTLSDNPMNINSYRVLDQYEDVDSTWIEYTAQLPQGARYFAIRNCSLNKYLFFVDNVKFKAAGKEVPVIGYNVYGADSADDEAEWRLINDAPLTETVFDLENVGSKYVRVHALFENGGETASSPFSLEESGLGSILLDENKTDSEYYNLNGQRLSDRPAAPGVYIVRRGNTVSKIILR